MNRNRDEPKEKVALVRKWQKSNMFWEDWELPHIWIAVSLSLEMCASCFLNCSRSGTVPTVHHPPTSTIKYVWNMESERQNILLTISFQVGAEGWGRLVDPPFPLLRHVWLFSVAAVWQWAVRAPAGFPGVGLILRALADGWQQWPDCLWLWLLSREMAGRCSLKHSSHLFWGMCMCLVPWRTSWNSLLEEVLYSWLLTVVGGFFVPGEDCLQLHGKTSTWACKTHFSWALENRGAALTTDATVGSNLDWEGEGPCFKSPVC